MDDDCEDNIHGGHKSNLLMDFVDTDGLMGQGDQKENDIDDMLLNDDDLGQNDLNNNKLG